MLPNGAGMPANGSAGGLVYGEDMWLGVAADDGPGACGDGVHDDGAYGDA